MKLTEAETISLVGCGGIGSWLLPPLLRFLAHENYTRRIVLWDGDHYTLQNAARQDFPEGMTRRNKARVQVERFQPLYPGLMLEAREEYVSDDNVGSCMLERSIIFSCVDNHKARVRLDKAAEDMEDVCIFSAGNEMLDGMCCVNYISGGVPVTESVLRRHPEIEELAVDSNDPSCEENIRQGATQLLVTNFMAAAATLSAFHALWVQGQSARRRKVDYECTPQEVVFDLRRCEMGAVAVT